MKTSVVSGGAGFLGSHLCDKLLNEGQTVFCLDNLLTGSLDNISHLQGYPYFRFVNYDVTQPVQIQDHVDYVYHFASPASPIDYMRLPLQTLRAGSFGTHCMLELALQKKARFLLASSSEVYGDPLLHPQVESYWGNVNPNGPRGVYDEAKRYAEAVTMAYHRYGDLDTRIARIFNTYGERMRMDDGRAIPTFIFQALTGMSLTVFGEGTQTRSVCYVLDMIDGIFKLMMSRYTMPMNLGNPDEITVLGLASEIIGRTGSKSLLVNKPLPKDDPKVRQPDITLARTVLGWEPRVGRAEGLDKTIQYFKERINETV